MQQSPQMRLVNVGIVSSKRISSLHLLFTRNARFLKAHMAFTLIAETIDFDS